MVSRNKRIVAAFAAVAAMGMGLAGCGSDTAGDTKTTDDGGVVNITYMHRLPDSEGMTLVNDIVAKWNKQHPDIQVKATKFDGKASDMIKKLETDVKSGEAPDLAQVGYAELPEVFTKGLLQDVTQYAEQYKMDVEKVKSVLPEKELVKDMAVSKAMDLVKEAAEVSAE